MDGGFRLQVPLLWYLEQVQYTTTYNTDIKEFLDEAKEPEYPVFENGYSQLSSYY